MSLEHLDLFSGIGGFALAAKWLGGIETTQFVEIDPFCQKVLEKNFKGVPVHGDIREFTASLGAYDLVTGGFPCQPHSMAGKRKASKDDRDLWPELYRIICAVRPRGIVLENVSGLLSSESGRFFRGILWDLAKAGYDAEWAIVSCADLGGSHKRERVWIVAYPNSVGCDDGDDNRQRGSIHDNIEWNLPKALEIGGELQLESREVGTVDANANSKGLSSRSSVQDAEEIGILSRLKRFHGGADRRFTAEPTICRGDDGIPKRVDRIRALGNAIVPQVAMIPLQRVLEKLERQNA